MCLQFQYMDQQACLTYLWTKIVFFWLNYSFSPLTFPKLQFWPPKKKTTKPPPNFCNCSSFGPQGQKKFKNNTWHLNYGATSA